MDLSENNDIFKLNAGCLEDSTDTLDWTNNCMLANQTLAYRQQFGSSFVPGPIRSPKRRGRPIANNAARERSRVKTLRSAFLDLQRTLPAVPPDTKLSKLDVLVLATTYIAHLMSTLADDRDISQVFAANGCMHPVKKWPMRTRLYAGILSSTLPQTAPQTHGQIHDQAAQWFTPEHDLN